MNVLNRALTVAALVALAVMLGVWLSRQPLTTAVPPVTVESTLAPSPIPVTSVAAPIIVEMPAEAEPATPPMAAKVAEPKPEPRRGYLPRRRGLFGRRR